MGEVKSIKSKILVILMIFMLMFSYYGFTFAAIATSEEFQVISNGFFRKDEMSFNAYFEDENGNRITETNGNVNSKIKLVLELTPEVRGFLKSGSIKAVSSEDGRINFKFGEIIENSLNGVTYDEEESLEEPIIEETEEENPIEEVAETEEVVTEETEEVVEEVSEEPAEEVAVEEEVTEPEEVLEEESTEEVNTENNIIGGATIDVVDELRTAVDEEESSGSIFGVMGDAELEDLLVDEDVLVDEDALIDETQTDEERIIDKKAELDRLIAEAKLDIKVAADNEISVNNVIEDTRIVVELEFKKDEVLSINDLSKLIKLQLSGTFINSDLEEVRVGKEAEITIGWTYTKDISLSSEYTKFSPFELGDISGSIVENKVTLTRDVKEENYLPIETTTLEIAAPAINGEYPVEVDVSASKLLATKGEDIGETNFTNDNWRYNPATGKVIIQVTNENNGKAEYTFGSDEYVIIYRFKDRVDTEASTLTKNVKATVKEYSAVESTVVKELNDKGEVAVKADELITYSISSSEEHINKASIYANYNSDTGTYETEFTNQVTVHMLTSDVLESLKINLLEDVYKDASGLEFDAKEIIYKRIKFNYSEVRDLLQNGGEIQILDQNNNLIYTLDSSLINSEQDCMINLGNSEGIVIVASGIARNGILNFEITKAITKSNYDKATFKNFKVLESRINAEVKYQKIDQVLPLEKIGTTKIFDESSTSASLSMNKNYLSTIYMNEDVELKIELNNDKPESDLYVNPSFEIVFPRYIKEVSIKNVNLLSTAGLSIDNYKVSEVDGRQRIIINLSGAEVAFSESTLTNGTNILILADIEVDESAPSREDQIKLYYCNEGVSTYEAQTKWSIEKTMPVGILKTTNGFDGELFKYQAPSGVVTTSGIINYDGNKSEIRSVRQGEKSAEIPMGSASRIAQMEVQVMNNTEDELTDLLLIGRIPFRGATDPITKNSTGSNVDTVMTDTIKEDINNSNIVEFYYSEKGDATPDIANGINAWRKTPTDLSKVKTFLIEVKGTVKPGAKLKFTYDFEIPANLPYESDINGAFGAVYNRKTESTIIYESSSADKVGLKTEAGPKVSARLTVDVGDGVSVGEARFLNYKLVVSNDGSIIATGVKVKNPLPENAVLYTHFNEAEGYIGNRESTANQITWTIDELKPGETRTFEYMLKTKQKTKEDERIVNKALVEAGNFATTVESNEVVNYLVDSNFDMEPTGQYTDYVEVGQQFTIIFKATNISGQDLNNMKITFEVPKEVTYKDASLNLNLHDVIREVEWQEDLDSADHDHDHDDEDDQDAYSRKEVIIFDDYDVSYDENTRTVTVTFDEFYAKEGATLIINGTVNEGNNVPYNLTATFMSGDSIKEVSPVVPTEFRGPHLQITQEQNIYNNAILEGQQVELLVTIKNIGNLRTTTLSIEDMFSNIENPTVELSGDISGNLAVEDTKATGINYALNAGGSVTLKVKGKASSVTVDNEKTIVNKATADADYCQKVESEEARIAIMFDASKPEEIPPREAKVYDEEVPGGNTSTSDREATNGSNGSSNRPDGYTENGGESNSSSGQNGNNGGNSSYNNGSNSSSNSSNSRNNSSSSANSNTSGAIENTYKVRGNAWVDNDGNSQKDTNEKPLTGLKVELIKANKVQMATITDGSGNYEFENVPNGAYSIIMYYDSDTYKVTTYGNTSRFVEGSNGNAISSEVIVSNGDVEGINIGLVPRETFNFKIDKYLSKAIVTTAKSEETYEFDNDVLAKVEIRAKELEGSTVKLFYSIQVSNIGDIEGSAKNIVDYLPKDMEFDPNENKDWYMGDEGNLYSNALSDVIIQPGNKSELTLVLTKKMTEENTGTVSNKVALIVVENGRGFVEDKDGNVNTQETLILIKTGSTTPAFVVGGACVVAALAVVILNRNKIFTTTKPTYSNKSKDKKKIFRKSYK